MAEEAAGAVAEPKAAKEYDKKIVKLGDEIVGLTLKEAVDLANYIKEVHGIEPP